MIETTEIDGYVYIKESRTGAILAGPYTVNISDPNDPALIEIDRRVTRLQHIYDTFQHAFTYLEDTGFYGKSAVANLFASCLDIQHNTSGASIIRNIRNGLEIFENTARSDARNEKALEWIKMGKPAPYIPFI